MCLMASAASSEHLTSLAPSTSRLGIVRHGLGVRSRQSGLRAAESDSEQAPWYQPPARAVQNRASSEPPVEGAHDIPHEARHLGLLKMTPRTECPEHRYPGPIRPGDGSAGACPEGGRSPRACKSAWWRCRRAPIGSAPRAGRLRPVTGGLRKSGAACGG